MTNPDRVRLIVSEFANQNLDSWTIFGTGDWWFIVAYLPENCTLASWTQCSLVEANAQMKCVTIDGRKHRSDLNAEDKNKEPKSCALGLLKVYLGSPAQAFFVAG